MSKKLIIYKKREKQDSYKPVMMNVATHDKIKEVQKACGLPLIKIIDICVNFAIENLEISEEKAVDYEIADGNES